MKITQIPMGTHNAQLTCYLQDPCTEMPALDRCPAILIFPGGAYAFCSDREADPVALAFLNAATTPLCCGTASPRTVRRRKSTPMPLPRRRRPWTTCTRTQAACTLTRSRSPWLASLPAGILPPRWAPWAGSVPQPCCWATLCSASRARRWAWSCRTCCSS